MARSTGRYHTHHGRSAPRPARIPIRTAAVAATDHGRRAARRGWRRQAARSALWQPNPGTRSLGRRNRATGSGTRLRVGTPAKGPRATFLDAPSAPRIPIRAPAVAATDPRGGGRGNGPPGIGREARYGNATHRLRPSARYRPAHQRHGRADARLRVGILPENDTPSAAVQIMHARAPPRRPASPRDRRRPEAARPELPARRRR